MAEAKIKIGTDQSGLNRGIAQVKSKFRSLGNSIKSVMGNAMAQLGIGLSLVGAVRAVDRLASTLDDIGKAAGRLQITTDEFQSLTFAAERSGVAVEKIETAVSRMNRVLSDAKDGNKEATDTLAKLGLTADELLALPMEERLAAAANAISGIEDASLRSAAAQELFGRSGGQLLTMLRDMQAIGDEFRASGAMITEEQIAAAERYKDAMTNLERQTQKMAADTGIIDWFANQAEGLASLAAEARNMSGGDMARYAATALSGLPQFRGLRGLGDDGAQNFGGGEDLAARRAEREARKRDAEARAAAAAEATAAAALAAAAEARRQEEERAAEIAQRQADQITQQLNDLRDAARVQELVNDGKEREAKILEHVLRLQRQLGRELTDAERAQLGEAAGAMFDLQQREDKAIQEQAAQGPGFSTERFTGGLAAIGGAVGKMIGLNVPTIDVQRNKILSDINAEMAELNGKLPEGRRFA